MLNIISSKLIKVLLNRKIIDENKQAIYFYGTMLLLSTLAGLLSITIISLLFFNLTTVLVFFAFFIPLRVHAGGYHCKGFFSCFVVSNILFVMIAVLAKILYTNIFISTYGTIIFSFITLLGVVAFSPVTNKNNPISPKKKKANRKKSIVYATLFFIIILFLNLLKFEQFDYYICLASISELSILILMIMEIIIERSTKNV